MIKNYLKIAWRNLLNKKFYSLINILGLAVGIFCCILIFMYVQDELSYDQFHSKSDRIYRVASTINFGGKNFGVATAPAPMAYTVKADFPEISDVVRFREQGSYLVKYENRVFKEEKIIYADSTLFHVFDFQFVQGDADNALKAPNSVVLTQKTAQKYFGTENPLGKTLQFDQSELMEVTGVVKAFPGNSHFNFDMYVSLSTLAESREKSWLSNNFVTYLVLNPQVDAKAFEEKLNNHVLRTYVMPQALQLLDMTKEELEASGTKIEFYFQPLTDIHLHSDLTAELAPNGSIQYVYIFSAIAIFVLVIACINFMNLSTARSAGRSQEVGIRKALGSSQESLIGQFLFESVALSMIAFTIALAGVQIALPYFNELAGKNLAFSLISNPELFILILIAALLIGVLAGIYPAFFLSSFQPVKVLKGRLAQGTGSRKLRSILVVAQFSISIILIIGTIIIYQQLHYVQQKNLGYQKNQVLLVENAYGLEGNLPLFKENLLRDPYITNATVTSFLPVPSSRSNNPFFSGSKMSNENSVSMQIWSVDYDYLPTMQMELAAGRNFSREMGTDSTAIIINQKAAEMFGFADPIGQEINSPNDYTDAGDYNTYRIIGVVKNFHFESLRHNIGALGMRLGTSRAYVALRFDAQHSSSIIQKVQNEWEALAPNQPFSYTFMDARFNAIYNAEQRMGTIMTIFAALAIFIACLGLFAMAAFSAEQRTKEIGVRKVLGASVADIIGLLSKDYLLLVAVSYVIALPIAWFTMNKWLQDFAYHISMSIWMLLIVGLISLAIALLTVSWQSIKAAVANPVESLKSE